MQPCWQDRPFLTYTSCLEVELPMQFLSGLISELIISGSRVAQPGVHRHPRVLRGQADDGHEAGKEGNLADGGAVPGPEADHTRDRRGAALGMKPVAHSTFIQAIAFAKK